MRALRAEARLRIGVLQVLVDDARLGEHSSAVDEHRDQARGIEFLDVGAQERREFPGRAGHGLDALAPELFLDLGHAHDRDEFLVPFGDDFARHSGGRHDAEPHARLEVPHAASRLGFRPRMT